MKARSGLPLSAGFLVSSGWARQLAPPSDGVIGMQRLARSASGSLKAGAAVWRLASELKPYIEVELHASPLCQAVVSRPSLTTELVKRYFST